ncbi:antitoxin [Larkinella rosea]|uniref:Antitoxin n=1 Tax=Larkinella rosea TaxID=2025312 RepID=A0A3P1BU91_9BACT|nr:antitoxin [Larkinella rosea]RRB04446.1 antitoxin [Larkinella rosea]
MTVLTVSIEENAFDDLEKKSKQLNLSSEKLIQKIIDDYLYLEKVNQIRQEMKGVAEEAGFQSEEDIFKEIS